MLLLNRQYQGDGGRLISPTPINVKDPAQWQNSIEGRLIEKINAAQSSIHIASFELDLTPVAEALIAAKQRGVDVRWVTDDEYGLESDVEPGHWSVCDELQPKGH